MADAAIGQRVQVDLGGLEAPGLAIGSGILGVGKIIDIDAGKQEITVRLDDLSFDGKDVITAPVSQVAVIADQGALAEG